MARYIDADKFKNHLEKAMEKMHLIGGVKGVGVEAVIKALDIQPTADVVPKSKVERLEKEVAMLNEEIAQLSLALLRDFPTEKEFEVWEACKAVKAGVAREIFEEIDKHLIPKNPPITEIDHFTFLDLKKKYTEEQI